MNVEQTRLTQIISNVCADLPADICQLWGTASPDHVARIVNHALLVWAGVETTPPQIRATQENNGLIHVSEDLGHIQVDYETPIKQQIQAIQGLGSSPHSEFSSFTGTRKGTARNHLFVLRTSNGVGSQIAMRMVNEMGFRLASIHDLIGVARVYPQCWDKNLSREDLAGVQCRAEGFRAHKLYALGSIAWSNGAMAKHPGNCYVPVLAGGNYNLSSHWLDQYFGSGDSILAIKPDQG